MQHRGRAQNITSKRTVVRRFKRRENRKKNGAIGSKRISLKKKVYYMKQEWAINGKKLKNDFFIEKTNAETLNAFFSKLSFSIRCTQYLEF